MIRGSRQDKSKQGVNEVKKGSERDVELRG